MFKPIHMFHIGLAVAAIMIGYKIGWRALSMFVPPPVAY